MAEEKQPGTESKKVRVLVIDDEPETVKLVKTFLELYGMEVISALTGMEGLMITTQQQPDVVVLDLMLPDADGYQLIRLLRHQSPSRDLPVVVVSARTSREEEDRGYKMGATGYLKKPVDLSKLVEEVQRVAKTRHTGPTPAMDGQPSAGGDAASDSDRGKKTPTPSEGRGATVHIPGLYIPRDNEPADKKVDDSAKPKEAEKKDLSTPKPD